MMQFKKYQKYGNKLKKYLILETLPLGIKLLQNKRDLPANAKQPMKDFGHHLSLCQAFAISRRKAESFVMFKEDMWCFEPVIGLGIEKAPKYFLEGNNRYPATARTLQAGKNWATHFPHFEYGKYIGIAFSPLSMVNFQPDLIIIYCNPTQLTQIMVAINWIDGNDINCRISGHAGCVYSIIPTIQNHQYQITVPCLGDRAVALAQNNEIIFSSPMDMIEDLCKGLKYLESNRAGLPINFQQFPEYELSESYKIIGKMIGMDIG